MGVVELFHVIFRGGFVIYIVFGAWGAYGDVVGAAFALLEAILEIAKSIGYHQHEDLSKCIASKDTDDYSVISIDSTLQDIAVELMTINNFEKNGVRDLESKKNDSEKNDSEKTSCLESITENRNSTNPNFES